MGLRDEFRKQKSSSSKNSRKYKEGSLRQAFHDPVGYKSWEEKKKQKEISNKDTSKYAPSLAEVNKVSPATLQRSKLANMKREEYPSPEPSRGIIPAYNKPDEMATWEKKQEKLRPKKTPYDPVYKPGGVPVGMNIAQPYEEDNPIQKAGKGIINYGLGTVGRLVGSVGQGMMNVSTNANNLIKGKPQDWREKSFKDDILEPSFPGAKDHPIISGIVETALDPTTYVGGGIVDDLAKTGRFGEVATKGTIKNAEFTAEQGKKLFKQPPSIVNKSLEAPTSQNKPLKVGENIKAPIDPKKPLNKLEIRALAKQETAGTTGKLDLPKIEPKTGKLFDRIDPTELTDTSGFNAHTNDVNRIFKKVFGEKYEIAKTEVLDPFDASKKQNILLQNKWLNKLKAEVVDKLGVTKNSNLSKLVQIFGEKKISLDELKMSSKQAGEWESSLRGTLKNVDDKLKISSKELKNKASWDKGKQIEFQKGYSKLLADKSTLEAQLQAANALKKVTPGEWGKVAEADKWFRTAYDELLDDINRSMETIYPNVEKRLEEVNQQIKDLEGNIQNKTAQRFEMEQGRPYKTNKELDLQSQMDRLNKSKIRIEDGIKFTDNEEAKALLTNKLESTKKQIELKQKDLRKANLYNQPTAKQFEKADSQIQRLKQLLKEKEELVKGDELWRNKRIPKRNDYYRHFRELSDTFKGVKNIFETPALVNPKLAGISDFTKPNSKFLSFAQKRGLGPYKNDAVGGFLEYLPTASYATHINPQIEKFRGLGKELANATEGTKNVNNFIKYLENFANSLAGKTNVWDRALQETSSRKLFNILNWTNSRVKKNTVLGNASSSLAQLANIPNGIAYVKNPVHLTQGIADTIKGIFNKNGPISNSGFIMERYSDKIYRPFNKGILQQPEKFASWLLGVGDEIGTKFIWNSVYRKGLKAGVKDAVKNADDVTRSLVAGRGIGEVPLMQQAKTFQLVAPFQLEVANLWRVMGDRVKEKDIAGLATLFVANYLFNRGMEQIKGSGVTFDPIKAIEDAFKEEDTTLLQKSFRLGGEVLSNIPLGSTIANNFVPENMRKKYFGKEDPTRFGSGLVLTKGLQDPLFKLLLPFGGNQVKKTIEGSQAVNKGMVEKNGKMMFPVANTAENRIKGSLFGQYSFPEAKHYFDNNLLPLGVGQTKMMSAMAIDKKEYRDNIELVRSLNKAPSDQDKNKIRDQIVDRYLKTKDFTLFTNTINNTIERTINKKHIKKELTDSQYMEYISNIKAYTNDKVTEYTSFYKDHKLMPPEKRYDVFNRLVNTAITKARNEMFKKIG